MTKYCTDSYYGTVDYKTTLEASDDVATVKWGGAWRMPTTEEQQELIDNCTWQWTTLNGVNGYCVTGPNGNSIFLPAAGYIDGSEVYEQSSCGYYWSGALYSINNFFDNAYILIYSGSDYYSYSSMKRNTGLSVRPLFSSPFRRFLSSRTFCKESHRMYRRIFFRGKPSTTRLVANAPTK